MATVTIITTTCDGCDKQLPDDTQPMRFVIEDENDRTISVDLCRDCEGTVSRLMDRGTAVHRKTRSNPPTTTRKSRTRRATAPSPYPVIGEDPPPADAPIVVRTLGDLFPDDSPAATSEPVFSSAPPSDGGAPFSDPDNFQPSPVAPVDPTKPPLGTGV